MPVVPVGLIGTREIMPRGSKVIHPGNVLVRIGEPVATEGRSLKERDALTAELRERVGRLIG